MTFIVNCDPSRGKGPKKQLISGYVIFNLIKALFLTFCNQKPSLLNIWYTKYQVKTVFFIIETLKMKNLSLGIIYNNVVENIDLEF